MVKQSRRIVLFMNSISQQEVEKIGQDWFLLQKTLPEHTSVYADVEQQRIVLKYRAQMIVNDDYKSDAHYHYFIECGIPVIKCKKPLKLMNITLFIAIAWTSIVLIGSMIILAFKAMQ
jgi:hypothetical protein